MFDLPPSPASAPAPSAMPRAQAPSADVLSCRPLQQTALYGRASAQMGADIRPLRLPDWQAWVVHRKVQALGSVAMLSRGPSLINAAQARALRPATGARHLIVHAEDATSADALAAAGFWSIARPTPVAELHLTGSPAEMAARLDGKWRNRLRHALKMNVTVTQGPMSPDTGHWLFTAEAQRAHDLGYRPMPPALVAAMSEAPGAAHLFTARRGGGVIAAMLFLRHGRRATYQIGWTNRIGRDLSASNLLMWRAMVSLQAMGCDRLDLGLADAAKSRGLAHFKAGTGAEIRELGGSWMTTCVLPRRWPRPHAGAPPAVSPSPPPRERARPSSAPARAKRVPGPVEPS